MGRQQAGSRTGDGSATGFGNRRVVRQAGFSNRVREQAGSQAGGVRQQAGSQAGRVRQQAGNWITGNRLGKLEHELAPAGWRSPA